MDIYIQNACFLVARTRGKIILVDDMRSKVKKKKGKDTGDRFILTYITHRYM